MSNIIPILTEILSRGIFNVIMATKRTVSVILLQEENDSDETNVQTVLDNAASALQQASRSLSEAACQQQSDITSYPLVLSSPGPSLS